MSPLHRTQLQVIETQPDRAITRLHQLARQREILRASFREAWDRLAPEAPEAELEAWCEGALALAHVNAGPGCLLAYWRASVELTAGLGLPALAAMAHAAADICRHAGAAAALSCLEMTSHAARCLRAQSELAHWSRGLVLLARAAPESVVAVASRTETILQSCDGAAFESFVAAGLKAGGQDRARRRAFFTLEDPLARQILEQATGATAFSDVERTLKAFATALWGQPPILRGVGPTAGQPASRRTSIAGGIIRVPHVFQGIPPHMARQIHRACVAHATAHLALTPMRFPVGSLKPLQVLLVGLIEDARIETLAMRRFPGLRRLWAPFHLAEPSNLVTAPALLARLARALFDPDYADDDGFVAKGRALFAAETDRLDDVSLSRRIGGLLGNDLGQMRVQFNARTHVVEPIYRDDGLGLWDFGDQQSPASDAEEVIVDAVRVVQEQAPAEAERRPDQAEPDREAAGRAPPAAPGDQGIAVAHYPEWDRAAGVERRDWTTVREAPPALAPHQPLKEAVEAEPAVRARIHRLMRSARFGRHERLRRRPDGPDLDLDAMLEATIALRAGETPDARVYRTTARRTRDLAVMLLLDVSESTRDRAGAGRSILDVERLAVAVLSEALSSFDDPFALRAFASAGRDDVRIARIKDFDEPYGTQTLMGLAGLSPGLSTRLGAALRHAGAELASVRRHRKLILVLTDGEPSDVDVADPQDLVEDARRVRLALKRSGIDVFGVTLDPSGAGSGATIFGRRQHMPVRRLEDLPSRLAELYFRLSLR